MTSTSPLLRSFSVLTCLFPLAGAMAAAADAPARNAHVNLNPWTGEGVSLGGILFPRVSYQAVAGSSTTDPASLASGHHDPDRHGITQQDIEFALSARIGDRLQLFGIYSAKIDHDDHWDGQFEEYHADLSGLPLDSTLKVGRFYTQFGYDNTVHPHGYEWVDKFLATGRLLGEDSATIYGAQISLPVISRWMPVGWTDRLAVSFGSVPDRDEEGHHHHGDEEEEEDHDHEHGEEHGHDDHHSLAYEGERAIWTRRLATADYTLTYSPRKATSYQAGVSGAWGGNDFGKNTQVYGAHFEYLWRPSGAVIPDGGHHETERGEFFRWRTEVLVRHFGAETTTEEEVERTVILPEQPAIYKQYARRHMTYTAGKISFESIKSTVLDRAKVPARKVTVTETRQRRVSDDFTDAGLYTALTYGFPGGRVQANLRAEYVSGIDEAELLERYRVSPALIFRPDPDLPIHFKLQYNYDHLPSLGDEHSVWFQFNLSWGDSCSHQH